MPPPEDPSPDADPVARLQGLLGGPGRRRDGPAPPAWAEVLRGRWSLPVTAGLAALVVVAVVAALLALRAVTTAPVRTPVPDPAPSAAVASVAAPPSTPATAAATAPAAAVPPAAGAGAAAGAGTAAAEVVVDVEGHVATPGLVRLPAGSRVDDAVRAAGGPSGPADLTRLNLARPLVDGEQVVVPAPGDPVPVPAAGPAAAVGPAAGGAAGAAPPAAGPVALGTATLADLDALPGVGPVLAQRIVDWRTQHGGFTSVDELGEVSGIGDVLLERLRPLVVV